MCSLLYKIYVQQKFLCLVFLLVVGCSKSPSQGRRGVYYWRTDFALSSENIDQLNQFQITSLYIRIFDVDLQNNQLNPVAPLRVKSAFPVGFSFVPVIYITPAALQNLPASSANVLADKIITTIEEFQKKNHWPAYFELQLDADWTSSNEEGYFELLRQVKTKLNSVGVKLSCTVRLHQLANVNPPVDRQLIMIYNVNSVTNPNADKTILPAKLAKWYIGKKLKKHGQIDIALPVYTWLSHFHGHRFLGLVHSVTESDLRNSNVEQIGAGWYQAQSLIQLGNRKIPKGDFLRFEDSLADSVDMANWLQEKLDSSQLKNSNMILFHYEPSLFHGNRRSSIQKIYSGY